MKVRLLIALFLLGLAAEFIIVGTSLAAPVPKCPDGFELSMSATNAGSFSCTPIKAAANAPSASSAATEKDNAQKRTAETIVAFSADHDIGKAKAGYMAALKFDPNYAPARYGLGLMLEAEEDWNGAREAFQQVVKNPKSGSFSAVAKAELADIEKTTNALKTPEGRKRLAYDDLIAQARLLLRSRQIPDAAKRAAEARKLDDGRWEAYMVAGEAMQAAGLMPEAILFFNASAKRAPGLYKENLAGVARELGESYKVSAGGKSFRDCPDCPEMVAIPGKNYEMGKYEVTQGKWKAVMGSNPSKFANCGDTCPVENVSWNDVQEFIQKLNSKTGKQYRLPTEAEWEYACYGGSQTEYCGSNDINSVAWYGGSYMKPPTGNSGDKTHPVGQKQANGYGLYDMSGNVWEWMSDCWQGNCAERVVRGSSWGFDPRLVRAANRFRGGAAYRSNGFGFRLARTLPLITDNQSLATMTYSETINVAKSKCFACHAIDKKILGPAWQDVLPNTRVTGMRSTKSSQVLLRVACLAGTRGLRCR